MIKNLIPVILAGGKGERFWPLSRRNRPKQFLSLDGSGESLLQATARRILALTEDWEKIWVITSASIADGVKEQLPLLPEANLPIEPEGRDTAAAIAWATLEALERYGEEVAIAFFPADHWISDELAFIKTIEAATELALAEKAIVTLGITPDRPSTGYGYIERGESKGKYCQLPAYRVNRFTEKPDLKTAESFIATGRYSWNSGIFVFRAGVAIEELKTHAPNIILPLKEKGKAAYGELEKKSIDYALMEKTSLACVIPAEFGWDDLGDWNALERLLETDRDRNAVLGNHLGYDSKGGIVYSEDEEEIIVTIGLEDIAIVRDRHVTLVVNKNRTQEIKQVLKLLEANPKFKKLL